LRNERIELNSNNESLKSFSNQCLSLVFYFKDVYA